MSVGIALLRSVNVGGKNRLAMAELKTLFAAAGCQSVETYIQSGNVVFSYDGALADVLADVRGQMETRFGFWPDALFCRLDAYRERLAHNPFPEASAEPSKLQVAFLLAAADDPDLATLTRLGTATERFALVADTFFLHAPDGIGRSKLAAKIERCLGVPITVRNWRTAEKVLTLADALDG